MRHLVPIAALVPVLAGCTWLGGWDGSSDVRPPREPARTVSVYAAVVRQLVTKDHTLGGADPGFKAVYILDGAVAGAARPTWPPRRPRTTFSDEVETDLTAALADLPSVTFVRARVSVIGDTGQVERGGVLVTLGPIAGNGKRAEVGASLWLGGKAARWLTYVVRRRGDVWRVTGETGLSAIA